MDSEIYAADERMVYVIGDDEAIRDYEMRQMALSDYNSAIDYAREEGLAEGMEKGMEKGHVEKTLEIARKMKEMGFSNEQIQTATGLPAETIAKL